jgi:hypothetical protein
LHNFNIDNVNYKSKLINYNNYNLSNEIGEFLSDTKFSIIVNTGIIGMGKHLAMEVGNTLAMRIIVISCNQKSFNKDIYYLVLKGYKVKEQYTIKTNYEINIYIIE